MQILVQFHLWKVTLEPPPSLHWQSTMLGSHHPQIADIFGLFFFQWPWDLPSFCCWQEDVWHNDSPCFLFCVMSFHHVLNSLFSASPNGFNSLPYPLTKCDNLCCQWPLLSWCPMQTHQKQKGSIPSPRSWSHPSDSPVSHWCFLSSLFLMGDESESSLWAERGEKESWTQVGKCHSYWWQLEGMKKVFVLFCFDFALK